MKYSVSGSRGKSVYISIRLGHPFADALSILSYSLNRARADPFGGGPGAF